MKFKSCIIFVQVTAMWIPIGVVSSVSVRRPTVAQIITRANKYANLFKMRCDVLPGGKEIN